MGKYKKTSPRLTVQYVDADTEEILFEVEDRTWMNVGELLSDQYADRIVKQELESKKIKPPQNLMIIVSGEYELI